MKLRAYRSSRFCTKFTPSLMERKLDIKEGIMKTMYAVFCAVSFVLGELLFMGSTPERVIGFVLVVLSYYWFQKTMEKKEES